MESGRPSVMPRLREASRRNAARPLFGQIPRFARNDKERVRSSMTRRSSVAVLVLVAESRRGSGREGEAPAEPCHSSSLGSAGASLTERKLAWLRDGQIERIARRDELDITVGTMDGQTVA